MGTMVWKDDYSVGDDLLDEQHKELIETINRLDSSSPLDEILKDLVHYADAHFRHEEAVMAKAGFPDLAQHRRQHKAFRAWLDHIAGSLRNDGENAVTRHDINAYLRVWLANHMLVYDQAFKPWIS